MAFKSCVRIRVDPGASADQIHSKQRGAKSLWAGTSCVGTVPGRIHKLPVRFCSKEQFIEEVVAQILGCESLDALVREANGGRSLKSFPILKTEVWHEWKFDREGIEALHPKWVNTNHNQAHMPDQVTSFPNLFLAGAHTRTAVDVWSIEAAAESGRRAARHRCKGFGQWAIQAAVA
jgi:hypothetical protein